MRKTTALLLSCLLALSLAQAAFAAEIEITLTAGERFLIPEGRRGVCTADDSTIVSVSSDTITALRPGRTVVRISGAVQTEYAVLVLFAENEDEPSPAGEPAETEEAEEAESPALPADGSAQTGEPEAVIQLPGASAAEETGSAEPDIQSASAQEPEGDGPAFQHYDRAQVPDLINGAIDLAFTQWEEDAVQGTKKFSRLGKYNKYSYWQCGSGSGCDIGWCGAFLGYVYDSAGVPMDAPADSVPHEGGVPYSVRAAGVGKIYTGFSNMDRLSMVPRPGYFVVYGQQKGYAYKHIGLVVDADDLGGGRYLIKTVEGNMSSTIRRYCYLFDSNETVKNLQPCPDEYVRDDAGINAYHHVSNWNITSFCQTWEPGE